MKARSSLVDEVNGELHLKAYFEIVEAKRSLGSWESAESDDMMSDCQC